MFRNTTYVEEAEFRNPRRLRTAKQAYHNIPHPPPPPHQSVTILESTENGRAAVVNGWKRGGVVALGMVALVVLLTLGVVYGILAIQNLRAGSATAVPVTAATFDLQAKELRTKRLGVAMSQDFVYEFEVSAVGDIGPLRIPSTGTLPHLALSRLNNVQLCCTSKGSTQCGGWKQISLHNGGDGGDSGYAQVRFKATASPTTCRLVYSVQT